MPSEPRAWYNEIDPYAAQWLRNLIQKKLIPDGDVDTRSIADVCPADLRGYTQCHFFAGLGGWPAALRRSGVWPDHRPVWTGSCPCQPFSVAGKQGGFADERHLWPFWQYLIEQCRPAVVFGEQVASASQWLRLVRGDLEALEYAVGFMPVEAASAGAFHLRDRYWFVGHDTRVGRGEGRSQPAVHERRGTAVAGDGGASAVANNNKGPQGRFVLPERADQRVAGQDGLADAARAECFEQWPKPNRLPGGYTDGSVMEHGARVAEREPHDESDAISDGRQARAVSGGASLEWVLGADGKARGVKSGIRLLAHGVPARVAKLRALGNAIDLRPATAFIQAVNESLSQ
jgi:DNA (cytosine-5)-methyltransferase 1